LEAVAVMVAVAEHTWCMDSLEVTVLDMVMVLVMDTGLDFHHSHSRAHDHNHIRPKTP
jgi:uncharacterized protein YceK